MMRLMGLRIFLAALLLAASAGALADVYKWTDERGVIVLSNVPPQDTTVASNVEVVAKEKRTTTRKAAPAVEYQTPTNEEVLQERIENLERQLRAQQYSRELAYSPPASQVNYYAAPSSGGYYATPPPPSYYGDSYYPSYPSYQYPAYGYPYVTFFPPVTSVFFRSRGHFHNKHSSHGFSHGTFPRSFAHGGVARTTGTFRGGRR
jgi:hypothetical protein